MKKASNKIPIKGLKDCSSNKQMKANKKIFCVSSIQVVTIYFTKLKINSGKHGSSMNKFTKHEKKLPKRGLDTVRPKRIRKKRKL